MCVVLQDTLTRVSGVRGRAGPVIVRDRLPIPRYIVQ